MFCKASAMKYREACFMVGYMYCYGDGIEKDIQKAKEYYQESADLGFQDAIKELEKLK